MRIEMTQAYATSLNLSFDVRGGLIMRQMHHWAALLFVASILVHMFRVFFTGAFRKPRETNWVVGVVLLLLGLLEGFAGYSLPDDALSGTGLRDLFRKTGSGDSVFDMPADVARIHIVGTYTSNSSNFRRCHAGSLWSSSAANAASAGG